MNLFKQLGEMMNPKSYHNTVPETGKPLAENTAKAEKQDEIVLSLFIRYSKEYTPYETSPELIWEWYFNPNSIPLTSIRRAFSNLQKRGLIEKTGEKVDGMYGRKINLWRLVK